MMSPDDLLAAIARAWPNIKTALSDEDWYFFTGRLTTPLRQLDDATRDPAAALAAIETLFRDYPAAAALVSAAANEDKWFASRPAEHDRATLDSPFGRRKRRASRRVLIDVLFGTDRQNLAVGDATPKFDNNAGNQLSFGRATVSIPDDHQKGRLERPRWYRLEFSENPGKHVTITALCALDETALVEHAQQLRQLDRSEDDAMLFVHGYNVSFEDCLRRTAQFAVDLEFKGIAIAYSWPSVAQLAGYAADANASEVSMFALADFIALLRLRLGLRRLHIVAHSMGSRLVARALNQIAMKPSDPKAAALHHVVFAAPDIDPRTFSGFAREFTRSCSRCTLYASDQDLALKASQFVYRDPRAGAAVFEQGLIRGIDSIDASLIDQSLIGHSYFSDERSVLADLHHLLETDAAPDDRFGLEEVSVAEGRYWRFTR